MSKLDASVAIVGAGPIGLELAVALKRAGIDYLHFDAKQVGYTISWFAPQTKFFSSNERISIAGVPLQTADQSKATREEYLAYLRSIVQQFDLLVNTYEPVIGIARNDDDSITLTTRPPSGQRTYRIAKLILATGGTDRPRRLNIPGENLPHVSISYRRERLPEKSIKYWLLPEINSLIHAGRIDAYFQSTPVHIHPDRVTLRRGNETFDVPADFVLSLIGYEQDNTLFKLAGLELSGGCGAPIFDEATMQTSVPNISVAGTAIAGTQDKYRVFIENCHVHVERIANALTGSSPPPAPAPIEQPES
jgi:thioredoxin reductase (NADPH)